MQIVLKQSRLLFVAGTRVHLVDLAARYLPGEWTLCGRTYLIIALMAERTQDDTQICQQCLKSLRSFGSDIVEFK